MKKFLIIGITVIMFFFKNQAAADYEKVFFDFKIDGITGEKIEFQDYKKKRTEENSKVTQFSEKIDELNQETDTLLEEIDKWQT